jgi:phytoene dehydrogenase-like protein
MFYWGVDKEYPQIAHHNVFLGGDYKASFDQIFNDHTLPDVPSFYVHAPARTDKAPRRTDRIRCTCWSRWASGCAFRAGLGGAVNAPAKPCSPAWPRKWARTI